MLVKKITAGQRKQLWKRETALTVCRQRSSGESDTPPANERNREGEKTMKAWNLKPGIFSSSAKSPYYPTFLLPANVLAEIWILAQSEDFASSQNFASGFLEAVCTFRSFEPVCAFQRNHRLKLEGLASVYVCPALMFHWIRQFHDFALFTDVPFLSGISVWMMCTWLKHDQPMLHKDMMKVFQTW